MRVDINGLKSVRNELNQGLERVRNALETYIEEEAGRYALDGCLDELHQIHGSLKMLRLHAAALLTDDVQQVLQEITRETLQPEEELFEVLFGAGLQILDYLDYVPRAEQETDLLLLPVINELRVAWHKPVLGEDELFVHVLCEDPQEPENPPIASSGQDLKAVAARCLPRFQAALLGVLKQSEGPHLESMISLSQELQQAGKDSGSQRIWWLTGAVAEALGRGELVAGIELKRLLGQISLLLRNTSQRGEAAIGPAEYELEYGLLYHIGRSEASGEQAMAVREAYGLDSLLPDAEVLEQLRSRLRGPNTALLGTVASEIRADLAVVRDNLDLLMRSGELGGDHSEQTGAALTRVAAMLRMLGLEDLQRVISRQAKMIETATATPDAESAEWQSIAVSLLWVDHSLEHVLLQGEGAAAEPAPDAISPQELQAGAESVLREGLVNLARIKDQVEGFSHSGDISQLSEAPRLLHELSAGLAMLGESGTAALVNQLNQSLAPEQHGLLTGNADRLARIADAISDLEKIIEAMREEKQGSSDAMLDELEAYVAALDSEDGELAPDAGEPVAETIELALPEEPAEAAPVADEIREIFLEELEDIQADLAESLPAWLRDQTELANLGNVRRSFHTLKGSGRMAGATDVGEFGWAIENLLNRCLEAEKPVTPEIVSVVQSAVDELPVLAKNLLARQPLSVTAQEIIVQAHGLAGTQAPTLELPPEAALTGADGQDDDLKSIFLRDAQGHLENIGSFLEEAGPELAPLPVPKEVVRAFHTLKSGASLAELSAMSVLAASLEQLCDECVNRNEPISSGMLQVVQQCREGMLNTLEAYRNGGELPDLSGLNEEVVRLCDVLEATAKEAPEDESVDLVGFTDEAYALTEQVEARLAALEAASADADERDRLLAALQGLGDLAQASAVESVAAVADRMRQQLLALGELNEAQRQGFAEAALGIYALLDELRQGRTELAVEDLLRQLETAVQAEEEPTVDETQEAATPIEVEAEIPAAGTAAEPVMPQVTAAEADEMRELFLNEGEELLEGMDHALDDWERDLQNSAPAAELLRLLHTIKGGARMAGAETIGDLSHDLESRIEALKRAGEDADKNFLADLRHSIDQIHSQLEQFRKAEPVQQQPAAEPLPPRMPAAETPSTWAESLYWQPEAGDRGDRAGAQTETARVPVNLLDKMLNEAGEISIYRGRLEQQHADLSIQLAEFEQAVERLRGLLRELDIQTDARVRAGRKLHADTDTADRYDTHFDPLEMDRYTRMNELSRSLSESAADLSSLHGLMNETSHDAETLLLQQGRVAMSLQHGLMDTLLVPFSRQVQRLQRLVRQTCQVHERSARVEFEGEENELDRNVLERMAGPLEHLMRNAIVHGIESTGERKKAGKDEEGLIRVVLKRDGTQSLLIVSDDGRGLDAKAIRKHAEARGQIPKKARVDKDVLWQFIFEPGFSTAKELTQEAGRGVGMDAVNTEIKQLGGTISVSSTPKQGTRFTIRIPSSLAITSALLIQANSEQFAIPMASIDGVERIDREALGNVEDQPSIEYGGQHYQLVRLADYLGGHRTAADNEDEQKSYPVLLIQAGETLLALVVDKVMGGQELVVKSLGPQVSALAGIKGGAILADGGVILILDIQALHQVQRRRGLAGAQQAAAEVETVHDDRPMVMVVDDSITIRRVTEKFLLRHGFRVCTAKDGMDALPKLQTEAPDLVLLDIEMPRIDGFEFATYMRNSEHFASIPIIMITSRSGEKHKQRAADIGVQDYMIKPYQEDALLRSIHEVMAQVTEAS